MDSISQLCRAARYVRETRWGFGYATARCRFSSAAPIPLGGPERDLSGSIRSGSIRCVLATSAWVAPEVSLRSTVLLMLRCFATFFGQEDFVRVTGVLRLTNGRGASVRRRVCGDLGSRLTSGQKNRETGRLFRGSRTGLDPQFVEPAMAAMR